MKNRYVVKYDTEYEAYYPYDTVEQRYLGVSETVNLLNSIEEPEEKEHTS